MESFLERLRSFTFAVVHNPNCPMQYQVRLVGKKSALLDYKSEPDTNDVCGYGHTMEEAAQNCWAKRFETAKI